MPPRSHLLDRVPLVERVDRWLHSAWERGLSSYPSLDPGVLMAKGRGAHSADDLLAGRSAEDAEDFVQRLERLCDALEAEARLNGLGRTIAHGQLARVIRHRHQLGALWRKRPELARTEIAPPIIVVGQMRAGTTRIHRLLAADPALSATRFCDSWNPVPRSPDLRPLWSGIALALGRSINPWLDTLHPFGAARADEELGWLAGALDHSAYEAQWHIPGFVRWSEACDPAPIYREFSRILRTDAAHAGNTRRPRVLKVPQFAEDLPALLAQFPDARIVVASRSEADVLKSAVSLVANQMTIQSDTVDLDWVEAEWRRKLALRQSRLDAALAAFGGPIAAVDFDRLGADPMTVIAKLYRALDLPLNSTAQAAMQREIDASQSGAHHLHRQQEAMRAPLGVTAS